MKSSQLLSCFCVSLSTLVLFSLPPLATAQDGSRNPEPVPVINKITVKGAGTFGGDVDMVTQVFKPDGTAPFPVLLFSHGRPGDAFDRTGLKYPVPLGHVRYWLQKGYALVAPIRPGYGETGGSDRENAGSRYDTFGDCISKADHASTANFSKTAMLAAIDWVRTQPWAQIDRILLEGQSVGGLATVALCATNLPGILGCINFAGGSGGSPTSRGKVCSPEVINALMSEWGKSTRVPNIWFYAPNDSYWGEETPKQWHKAFAAGGSPTTFIVTTAVPGADGHSLLYRGGKMWSIPLNDWLKKNGL